MGSYLPIEIRYRGNWDAADATAVFSIGSFDYFNMKSGSTAAAFYPGAAKMSSLRTVRRTKRNIGGHHRDGDVKLAIGDYDCH